MRLLNLIVFVPLSLATGLIASCGVLAIAYTLMLGGSSIIVLLTLFTATFSWIAWVSGERAYRYAFADAASLPPVSVAGLKAVALVLAGGAFLAAIAAPMFSGLPRKSREGALKGNLGALRAALAHHARDAGAAPSALSALTAGGKYLTRLPTARVPYYHEATDAVAVADRPDDAGGWLYEPALGTVRVNCTHTDTRGKAWNAY